jgi:3-oxoacyl-[acyl-carrier-protein] synthase II
MSEGSGILVLESWDHAVKRNAPIYCEVLCYGTSSDPYNMVASHPEGKGLFGHAKSVITGNDLH